MPPNDFERILLGRVEGNPRASTRCRASASAASSARPASSSSKGPDDDTLTPRDRVVRRLRVGALALASALALAACEAQPVGSFQNAKFVADGSQALQSVYFQPGSPQLRAGEAERIRSFLSQQMTTPETDILLHVGRTGSPLLVAGGGARCVRLDAAHPRGCGYRVDTTSGRTSSPTPPRSRWCSTTGWW